MAVSQAVRRYYAERIFANMGRDKVPANFRPLDVAAHGLSTVEGCRGGGKNILEVTVLVEQPAGRGPGGPGAVGPEPGRGAAGPERSRGSGAAEPGRGGRLLDLRLSCGLCNPAMYACADVVVEGVRGRPVGEVLALDPLRIESLAPFFQRLGGPGRPDDAREKFQYTLIAVQNALRAAVGLPPVPPPPIEGPTDKDWDQPGA